MKLSRIFLEPKPAAFLVVLTVYFSTAVAHAAPAKGGVPKLDQAILNTMFFQAINVAILFGGLIFFVWPTVRDFVKARARSFDEAAQKAQLELQRANAQLSDLNQKIQIIKSTRNDSLVRARAEAAELRKQILADAQEKADRFKREIGFQMGLEIEKAKQKLKAELMNLAIQKASIDLRTKLSKDDHDKLLTGFTDSLKERVL